MERVLYITSTRIGDAVLASGVLGHLVETRPHARFTVAAGPLAAPLFRAAPRLEDLIVMDKKTGGGHWLDLWRRTVLRPWSLVVDQRGSRTSWFLLAGQRAIAPAPRDDRHKVVEAAELLRLAPPPTPTIWLDAAANDAARAALPAGGPPILAISPAASTPFKTWPAEHFASFLRHFAGPRGPMAGARVAVFGGPGDEAVAAAAVKGFDRARLINLTGKLDILATAGCLARARLFVGNDSGLMHLAAAAGAPTLGLFGPTDERVYGPWGRATRTARAGPPADPRARDTLKKATGSLMADLSPQAVAAAAAELLAATGGESASSEAVRV